MCFLSFCRSLNFSIDPILPVTIWNLGQLSLQQILVIEIILGIKGSWHMSMTNIPPSVTLLSRKFGNLDISHPSGPPLPLKGIAFTF
jgi:hypothetical protein